MDSFWKRTGPYTDPTKILLTAELLPSERRLWFQDGQGVLISYYWHPDVKASQPLLVTAAKQELLNSQYAFDNPETGLNELPWDVYDQQDMIDGIPKQGLAPYEIYNPWFVANKVWPDLMLIFKPGLAATGMTRLINYKNASHGSLDTASVMLAIQGVGFTPGTECQEVARTSDVSPTVLSNLGISFFTNPGVVGQPLHCTPLYQPKQE